MCSPAEDLGISPRVIMQEDNAKKLGENTFDSFSLVAHTGSAAPSLALYWTQARR